MSKNVCDDKIVTRGSCETNEFVIVQNPKPPKKETVFINKREFTLPCSFAEENGLNRICLSKINRFLRDGKVCSINDLISIMIAIRYITEKNSDFDFNDKSGCYKHMIMAVKKLVLNLDYDTDGLLEFLVENLSSFHINKCLDDETIVVIESSSQQETVKIMEVIKGMKKEKKEESMNLIQYNQSVLLRALQDKNW